MSARWRYASRVRLRRAGFPFAWLTELADGSLARAQERYAHAEAGLERAGAELVAAARAIHPVLARELARRIERRREIDADFVERTARGREIGGLGTALAAYAGARAVLVEADAALVQEEAAALDRARRASHRFAQDPRFREAVELSSPSAAGQLDRGAGEGARDKGERKWEQLVWLYLQRLCAKNDTASFFGPVVWGELREGEPEAIRYAPEGALERRVFFERWAVVALAEAASADPALRPNLSPRPSAHVRLEGDALVHGGRSTPLDVSTAVVLRACDGQRTALEVVARAVEAGLTEADAWAELEALEEARAIRWAIDVPTGDPHPERWLRASLERAGPAAERWLGALEELEALRREAERGTREARARARREASACFERHASVGAERHGGAMYAGRGIFYEDCGERGELRLGAPLLAALGPLEPLFEISAWIGHRTAGRYRDRFRALWSELPRSGAGVALPVFLRAIAPLEASGELERETQAEVARRWEGLTAEGGASVEWTEARLWQLVDALGPVAEVPGFFDARFQSPDLLVAAREGGLQIVLGELHRNWLTLIAPGGFPFCPAKEALARELCAALPSPLLRPVEPHAQYHARRQVLPVPPFELFELDWDDRAPPRVPRERALRVADLFVVEEGGELFLQASGSGQRFDLFATLEATIVTRLLSIDLPFSRGPHHPRITVGQVVIQRERWVLERPLELEPDPMRAVARLRARLGLPEWVFCKASDEPKPLLVHFGNPISVEQFAKLARRPGTLSLSEMLPGPDALALRHPELGPLTSELRLTAIRQR